MDRQLFYGARPLDLRTRNFLAELARQAYNSKAIQRWGVQHTGNMETRLHILWGAHGSVRLTLAIPAQTEVRHSPRLIIEDGFNPLVWTIQWRDSNGLCTLRSFMALIYELRVTD